jgi:hypothetical protein
MSLTNVCHSLLKKGETKIAPNPGFWAALPPNSIQTLAPPSFPRPAVPFRLQIPQELILTLRGRKSSPVPIQQKKARQGLQKMHFIPLHNRVGRLTRLRTRPQRPFESGAKTPFCHPPYSLGVSAYSRVYAQVDVTRPYHGEQHRRDNP